MNEEFGVKGSSSYHGRFGAEYDRRYKASTAKFKPHYDAISEAERLWLRRSDITIPEFLFLDNFTGKELASLMEHRDFAGMHFFSFIEAKANALLERWKKEFNVAGMHSRVAMELDDFRYARKRCIRHFDLRLWHWNSHREIRLYRSVWAQRLKEGLERMRVA